MFKPMKAIFLLPFLVPLLRVASATCYFPDNSVAKNDTPCTDATLSTCCQAGATCLDNGLCFDPFGSAVGGYIRGSCTDKTWASANCPQYCTYDNATSGLFNSLSDAGVVSCGNNGFCCESDPVALCNCQTGHGTFTISGDLKPFTTIASSSSTVASTNSPTTTASSSSATLSTTTSTSSPAASSSPTNTSPPAPSNNTAVKVGLGVGIPLGCALVGVLGVIAYLLRRRQRQQKAGEDPDPSAVHFIPPTGPMEYKQEGKELNKFHEAPGSETFPAPQRARTQIYEAPGAEVYRDGHEMPA